MENIERREKRNSGKESIYKVIRDFVNYKPGIECYDELIHIIGIRPMILHPKTKFECDLDGFVGTRKRMIWHIKSKHKEFLEMVE